MLLLGTHEEEDTTLPPGPGDESSAWISKYLNSRYFSFPRGISVCVDEGSLGSAGPSSEKIRALTGQKSYLDDHALASGTLKLSGARAHWWILEDDRSLAADASYIESAGHVAALYQNELYELRSGRVGTGKLQQFGITFGFRRVVIYLEPRPGFLVERSPAIRLVVTCF